MLSAAHFAALATLVVAGCVTEKTSDMRAREAYQRGRLSTVQPAPVPVAITVVGPVKNRSILWAEGLTLARVLLAAEYTAPKEPVAIFITRNGQTTQFDPQQISPGNEGPLLLPGDVIEVR
ncbi:MAG: hypothetical protein HY300_12110 [Verrucomicrobia bacterium]|nr:hypothetical protein [Verrucomicrobiota bacterium]